MAAIRPLDAARFRRGFAACALCRNLQILGAFGFLSTVRGKKLFARYIPAALRSLASRLAKLGAAGFPNLRRSVVRAEEKLGLR
jgi:hypothetical protein